MGFLQQPKILIKLILSISFAEESDLGWDQTIKARYKGNIRVFNIVHINDKYTIVSKKPGSSKRSINEDSEEERPSKRARQEFLYS